MIPIRRAAALLVTLVFLAGSGCTFEPAEQRSDVKLRRGGDAVVAVTEPDSIDPSKAQNKSGLLIIKQICDTLVAFDPATAELKPGIAESWMVASDGKKVTFKLSEEVKFHNGRAVTADDFVYSISRFVSPKSGSTQHFFFDKVVGYADVRSERAPTLAGVKAPDKKTLDIELSEPFAEITAVMAHPAAGAAIPREEADKGEPFATKPVCSGPYMVQAPYVKGEGMTVSRYPDYRKKEGAFLDKIRFRTVSDATAGYKLLTEGKADIAEVPVEELPKAQRIDDFVFSATNGHVAYLGLPVTKPPYDNASFRKALALAIDRRDIIEDLLAGSRSIPSSMLPPAAGPVGPQGACKASVRPRSRAVEAAEALSTSGIDAAQTTPAIYFNSGGGHERWLERVTASWKEILGLESTLTPDEWKKYLDTLAQTGVDGPFRLSWAVRYPSPEAMLEALFLSGSLDNFTRFSNKEFDDLIRKARATPDSKERLSIYALAGELLCRELPIIPMWFGESHFGFASRVKPAEGPRLDVFGDPVLRGLSLQS